MTTGSKGAWLPLAVVEAAVPEAAQAGVSEVARGPNGFLGVYRAAGSPRAVPEAWRAKREGFVKRHMAQVKERGEPLWVDGAPTRRHLALVMWAYSPTPAKLDKWLAEAGPMENPVAGNSPGRLFHGTNNDVVGQRILADGFVAPPTQEQLTAKYGKHSHQRPVSGKTYVTRSPRYALIYALGANMAGKEDLLQHLLERDPKTTRYGWIFEVQPEPSARVSIDEDTIGEWAANGKFGLDKEGQQVGQVRPGGFETLWQRAKFGYAAAQSALGKRLAKSLPEARMAELILHAENLTVSGPVKIVRAWRVDKANSRYMGPSSGDILSNATGIVEWTVGHTKAGPEQNPVSLHSEPLVLWHGSQHWEGPPTLQPAGKRKSEHGSGLYLTTSADTARKYAKGGGSVLRFELDPNLSFIGMTTIDLQTAIDFVRSRPRLKNRAAIEDDMRRVAGRRPDNRLLAVAVENLMANHGALTGSHGPALAQWYVSLGIDASLVRQSNEDWVVLYNLDKIRRYERVPAGQAVDSPLLRHSVEPKENPASTIVRKTLYRAADDDILTGPSAFSSDKNDAEKYLDNRGFGGKRLFVARIECEPSKILDVRSEFDHQQLEALVDASNEPSPGAMTADAFVMQDRVAAALVERGYRWVRLLDTYPSGSETWVYLYDGEDPAVVEVDEPKENPGRDPAGLIALELVRDAPDERIEDLAQRALEHDTLYGEAGDATGEAVSKALRRLAPKGLGPGPRIFVYHATDADTARRFQRQGFVPETKPRPWGEGPYGPGQGLDQGLYVGHSPGAVESYGRVVLQVEVPPSVVRVSSEQAQAGVTDPMEALRSHDGAVVMVPVPASAFQVVQRNGGVVASNPARSTELTVFDQAVLEAVRRIGGGTPRKAIYDRACDLFDYGSIKPGDFPAHVPMPDDVSRSLRKLQDLGLVYSHDGHGQLTVWRGAPKQQGKYWSTREQLVGWKGIREEDLPVRAKRNPGEEAAIGAILLASPLEEMAVAALVGTAVSNPTKPVETIRISVEGNQTADAVLLARHGNVAAIEYAGKYNVMYVPRDAAFMKGVRTKAEAVKAAQFYGKEPEGVAVLEGALQGKREAVLDMRAHASFKSWLASKKSAEPRKVAIKYRVLVARSDDRWGINRTEEKVRFDTLDDAIAFVLGTEEQINREPVGFAIVEIEEYQGSKKQSLLIHKRMHGTTLWTHWTPSKRHDCVGILPIQPVTRPIQETPAMPPGFDAFDVFDERDT